MTILFDSNRTVKPATRRPFATGLSLARRASYTASDAAWWAKHSPSNNRGYDVIGPSDAALELATGAALAQERMDCGICPF